MTNWPEDIRALVDSATSDRCPVCDWPMAGSVSEGCVPGNCSYRPTEGSPEWHRIRQKRLDAVPALDLDGLSRLNGALWRERERLIEENLGLREKLVWCAVAAILALAGAIWWWCV